MREDGGRTVKSAQQDVTRALARVGEGHEAAVAELMPLVYEELRRVAGDLFQGQTPGHSLQATALVHEAYLRLVGQTEIQWESRAHFFAVAAMAMRQVLSNHARAKRADKRGGGVRARVSLSEVIDVGRGPDIDLLVLHEALEKLAALDERQCRIVEQRVLGGMTHAEIAHVLGVSSKTVEREWRAARAWLSAFLGGSEAV